MATIEIADLPTSFPHHRGGAPDEYLPNLLATGSTSKPDAVKQLFIFAGPSYVHWLAKDDMQRDHDRPFSGTQVYNAEPQTGMRRFGVRAPLDTLYSTWTTLTEAVFIDMYEHKPSTYDSEGGCG